ncbi:MAG TPA: chitobiase/beta-hexosaminidase C-terminal domain-containing protein, partial [Vicinamibacterales bacterium]|nr:chitobiase/beta-hexosaminidase C-terminal domain-containing protein [Vicinamibacterales bacterium]
TPDEPGFPVTIRYTLDGTIPTESSTAVTGPVLVDRTLVMKARAFKGNMAVSHVNTASFAFQAAQPAVGVPAGTYTSALDDVQFLSATEGAQIRYTTNLTDPTATSTLYTGPIDIAHTTTYRIAAFKNGYARSAVTQAYYTMNFGTLPDPVVTPASGTHLGSVTITMSTSAPGVVYYTANPSTSAGGVPTSESSSANPVTFTTTTTVRARSIHPDYTTSDDTTRTYIIKANKPTLSATSGSYAPGSVVTITADQPSVDILRMTIDGTEPSDLSPLVASGSSILLGNFTLKVRAFREDPDDIDSDTESAAYSLTSPLGPGSASAGGAHSLIATPDGRVFAWGRNGNGQLGIGSTTDKSTPTLVHTLTGVTAISSGAAHSVARTWDGQVYSWGSNGSGRLGDGTSVASPIPVHVWALANIAKVAAGDMHSLALTSDGRVYAWGENSDGQLGIGSTFDSWVPTMIDPLTNVVAIAAGGTHSLAVTASGQLYAWGNNASARLGDGTTIDRTSPVLIGVSDAVAVAAGGAYSLAMSSSGALYSWGLGTSGQLGHGAVASVATPQLIQGVHASAIAAGDSHSAAIRHDGVLVAWGAGGSGQIGDGGATQRNAPAMVNGPASVSTLALGDAHAIAVTPTGEIWTWGEVDFGRLGDASTQDRLTPAAITPVITGWAPAAPTVNVASGSFATAQTVTVLSPEAGAAIRYTLDGTEPTDSAPVVPVGGVLDISAPSRLRAKVFATGRAAGTTARANYVLQPPAPIIDPPSGNYLATQTVTIWGSGSSAVVRYTLNGSDPTTTSTLYEVPFEVSATTVVKAREFPANGWDPSVVSTSSLVFNGGALDPPTATPAGGTFFTAPQVSLSTVEGAAIRYTLNGTTPTASSTLYAGPITISAAGATLKSIAFHPTLPSSAVRTDVYVVDTTAPTITARYQPALLNSWSSMPVEVSFVCGDNRQVAFCSPPATFTEEGAGQGVTGIAEDSAGNRTQLLVTVNLDFTPPTVAVSSPIDGSTTTNSTLMVTGQVGDSLSGLASVKCNEVNATVVDGAVSCQVPLRAGRNVVVLSAVDLAGNAVSHGVTVTLVGTVTSLTLTPSQRTMVVGELATLSARDAFGVLPTGVSWSTSDASVVSLSADVPPVVTALAEGTASITVRKGFLTSQSQITVVAGDSNGQLPPGTTRWKLPTTTSSQTRRTAPIFTQRIAADGPDFFTVEPNFSTNPAQYTVRATSNEGAVLWKEAAPGLPLMGDAQGALIAGVEGEYRCALVFGEDRFCFRAFVRFGVSGTILPWRYHSAGYLDRPAHGPDGTIYAIEHINGARSPGWMNEALHDSGNNKSVVILDGETGRVTARVALPSATSTGPDGTTYYYEPKTIGPIVGADGNAYVVVGNGTGVSSESWTLVQLSRAGQMSGVGICTVDCASWKVYQLVPDGVGGLLIRVELTTAGYRQARLIRFDEEWQRSEYVIGLETRIDLVGQAGTIFLQTRTGNDDAGYYGITEALDVTTFSSLWTKSPGWKLTAAKPDGGGTALNSAGQIVDVDPTGQQIGTMPFGLADPISEFGSLIGQGTAELIAKSANVVDATRYNAAIARVGHGLHEPNAF